MTATLFIGIASFLVSLLLLFATIFVDNPDAYKFPQLLATTMCLLAMALIIVGKSKNKELLKDLDLPVPLGTLWPGLTVFLGYILLAEKLGFYITSLGVFLALVVAYAPRKLTSRNLTKQLLVALSFMAIMYSLFTVLLQVQIPGGIIV